MIQVRKLFQNFGCKILHQPKSFHKLPTDLIQLSEEVAEGLSNGSAVVALESTVITHGLPYPQNLSTAIKLETIVRENKAVPATIGIVKGTVHVGMSSENLEVLASQKENVFKVSRRDIPFIVSKALCGGTTVAATMAIAQRVGISVFATGGIGGVHRGAEKSMDVSADLYELSRTPMTVVSAGVKSILDIGLTLEYLESLGVCVATFGCSKEFPSFFTPHSGFFSPCNVENPKEAAHLIDCRDKLGLENGILLAAPIPDEYYKDGMQTDAVIAEALKMAKEKGVLGRDITPFVLQRVHELSGGASLRANLGLLENNAKIGSHVARELWQLKKQRSGSSSPRVLLSPVKQEAKDVVSSSPRPVVIGGSMLDIHVKALQGIQLDGRTICGQVHCIAGGVGRNVADCLARLQTRPLLVSVLGKQGDSSTLLERMGHMDLSGLHVIPGARTASCVVLIDENGECLSYIGDMDVFQKLTAEQIELHRKDITQAPLVVIDGNIPEPTVRHVLEICGQHGVPVWFEPTDVSRAHTPFGGDSSWKTSLRYASPNLPELRVMHNAIFGQKHEAAIDSSLDSVLEECVRLGAPLLKDDFHTLAVTLGAQGVLLLSTLKPDLPLPTRGASIKRAPLRAIHYPAHSQYDIVSVSGAGDCFAAGMIAAALKGLPPAACIEAGQRSASLSLASHHAVPDTVCPESVFPTDRDRRSGRSQ